MRRILTSLLVIGVVGVAAFGASRAFFSDTETSSGNVLAAGAIDLLIDNTSYRTNSAGTALEASEETSWSLRDLTVEKFFNFFDLKPGDEGENTISLHVNNNDAYACAHVAISQDIDNGFTDPEDEMFAGAGDGTSTGDLDEELYFVFWEDDGDNVYENNEDILVQGPVSNIVSTGGTLTIADSSTSPLSASSTSYIGSYFCYGNVTSTAGLTSGTGGPDTRSSGFTCDGAAVTNRSQTDMLIGDLSFYAVQSRNNDGFTCSTVQWPTPVGARVGAALSGYEAPTNCNVYVDQSGTIPTSVTTISSGISTAIDGQTVCVADGTYNENVTINKNVTLASLTGPTATAVIDGVVSLTHDGATLTGFDINPSSDIENAISVSASNTTVSYNYIHGLSNASTTSMKGIHVYKSSIPSPLTNVSIVHNKIDGVNQTTNVKGAYGIMVQGTVNGAEVMYNNVMNVVSDAGWASGIEVTPTSSATYAPKNIAIQFNHIENVNGFSEPGKAVTVDWVNASNTSDASQVMLSINNFVNTEEDVRNLDTAHTLSAPNNYWGATVDPVGPGSIDTTPTQVSAYPTY